VGNILSGNRRPRASKKCTTSAPLVRLTHASHFAIKAGQDPCIVPLTDDSAVVRLGQREWPVALTFTAMHFGGQRRWMLCPRCEGRKQTLFISRDALACRACLDLRYESQNENMRGRSLRRIEKIRRRLGWQPGVLSPSGVKPARMHWKTYCALEQELARLTDTLLNNMNIWADKAEALLDRSGRAP